MSGVSQWIGNAYEVRLLGGFSIDAQESFNRVRRQSEMYLSVSGMLEKVVLFFGVPQASSYGLASYGFGEGSRHRAFDRSREEQVQAPFHIG
jgi:hypothetical protein